jgi:putative FmdB family regulatory protein
VQRAWYNRYMPLYDYRCASCHKASEIRHGFGEQAGPCPSCGGVLERQFHAAPIIFNGSGFYVTDSRPKASSEKSSEAKPAEPKPSETTPSVKSDTAA